MFCFVLFLSFGFVLFRFLSLLDLYTYRNIVDSIDSNQHWQRHSHQQRKEEEKKVRVRVRVGVCRMHDVWREQPEGKRKWGKGSQRVVGTREHTRKGGRRGRRSRREGRREKERVQVQKACRRLGVSVSVIKKA